LSTHRACALASTEFQEQIVTMNQSFLAEEPARGEIDALPGLTLLEFGTPWCGHCEAAQPSVGNAAACPTRGTIFSPADATRQGAAATPQPPSVRHNSAIKDGQEMARLVRPAGAAQIEQAFAKIDPV
jgi:thioredoxin 1